MCPNIDVASRGEKLVEGKPKDTDQWVRCGVFGFRAGQDE